jgi:hypothetical protein
MKQLILYFLFFVASSLILIQCARFFPSIDTGKETPFENKKVNTIKNKEKEKAVLNQKKSTTDNEISRMAYISYWPYHVLQKINKSNLLNNSYNVVQQYNLTSSNIMQEK